METRWSPLDKTAKELTVMDVYDIAAILGHEFERIIDQYGCEALLRLMPKVVRILELLEVLVSRSTANPETEDLRRELDRLRQERNDRFEKEKKHQKDLELVEDVWRGETQDLLSQISQLQAEKKQLQMSLSIKDVCATEELLPKPEGIGMPEREQQTIKKLKEMVEKQKDELRANDQELTLRNEDIEALQMQQYRTMKINQDLRHRVAELEAEAVVRARQRELGALRLEPSGLRAGSPERRRDTTKTPAAESDETPPASETGLSSPSATAPQAASLVGAKMDSVEQSSIWVECGGDPRFLADCFESEKRSTKDGDEDEDVGALLLQETSPDGDLEMEAESEKPCFTLQDLCDVLQEKNELKSQVFMLREELAYYKSEEPEDVVTSVTMTLPHPSAPHPVDQPESGIRRLIFTAIMPMVAAGLIQDDPTLLPIRRLVSFV